MPEAPRENSPSSLDRKWSSHAGSNWAFAAEVPGMNHPSIPVSNAQKHPGWWPARMERSAATPMQSKGDGSMQSDPPFGRRSATQAHPISELLECPPGTASLLNASARCLQLEEGQVVFRQGAVCHGLYVIISGQFLRRTERLETRLTLGLARAGELVELAAILGDHRHTYTLTAQTAGSVLLLPADSMAMALEAHPPLRMRLLAELAREVSRSYEASCLNRLPKTRRRSAASV